MSVGDLISALVRYGERLDWEEYPFLSERVKRIETTSIYAKVYESEESWVCIDRDGFEVELEKFEESKEKEKIKRAKSTEGEEA